ncbi:sporulation protein [Nonomuraea mangrovi]|uniref:Sporulation protein n=1 Tax=Nonomuraea mangrovi TaxID=2316207 RepID=A0ABW4SSH2_9ACTN
MVFKRMLGAFGVGAPTVDTVLTTPRIQPGGRLSGEVRLKGGDFDAEIEHVTLGLVARVEIEHGEGEGSGVGEFFRTTVSGPFTLAKGEDRTLAFTVAVPWETPLTEVGGRPLTGMAVGVRTELAIAKAVDKGDLDPVAVEPLPSQLRVLEAFPQLGFQFRSADLEVGSLYGVRQELPFYQEIEFYAPGGGEAELTFVADEGGLEIVLESGGRSGDAIGRFHVTHEEALRTDWAGEIDRWMAQLSQSSHHGHHGHHGYDHDDHGHGGPGFGAVAAGAAAGVVGGLVMGEAIEEIFEGDEGDGGDGDW